MRLPNICTLLHAPFEARAAGAFVASFAAAATTATPATTWCKGYTCETSAGNPSATRRSRGQDRAVSCPQVARTLLQKIGGYDGGYAPATVGTSAASPNIQAPTAINTPFGSILDSLMKSTTVMGEFRGDADAVLYFAFGANMCPSILTTKRGVHPRASLPVEAIRFATSSGPEATSTSGYEEEKLCLCFCHRAGIPLGRNAAISSPLPPFHSHAWQCRRQFPRQFIQLDCKSKFPLWRLLQGNPP